MTAAAIHATGWGWRHAGRTRWAVRDLDLEIPAGQHVLLLGPSGAGKSTLLAGLAGVLGGDEEGEQAGALLVAGRRPAGRRGTSGLLLQDPDSQVILSRIGDDVAFGCENLGVPADEIWRRVHDALEAVGLELPPSHPTSVLSGGQKQRLALAGVLAMRPGLLLLDEPTANLDPDGVAEVRDAVARAASATGATLVVVEHRVGVWRDAVDRVVVLGEDGRLLADGPPDGVFRSHAARLRRAGVWLPGAEPTRAPEPVAPAEPLLTAEGLEIGRAGAPALTHDLGLTVAGGRSLAVTGPNGAGKSTLALTLAGLLAPLGGVVRAEPALAAGAGPAPHRWSSRRLAARIGSVFQSPEHQFVASTVRRELAVGPRALRRRPRAVADRVDELLVRLRLDGLADANPFTLSGGQKRRLAVATALATRPRLLVLDEPTFGQDAVTWRELVDLLLDLRADGHGIVAVSHDLDFVHAVGAEAWSLPRPAGAVAVGGRA